MGMDDLNLDLMPETAQCIRNLIGLPESEFGAP